LQHVELEAALDNGQFVGFRIVRLEPPELWRGIDLQPGDVVTRVNGMPIERETQAYDAFMALKSAQELRVSMLRGGAERTVVFSIVPRPKP
jgi:general secretion pathway protein C